MGTDGGRRGTATAPACMRPVTTWAATACAASRIREPTTMRMEAVTWKQPVLSKFHTAHKFQKYTCIYIGKLLQISKGKASCCCLCLSVPSGTQVTLSQRKPNCGIYLSIPRGTLLTFPEESWLLQSILVWPARYWSHFPWRKAGCHSTVNEVQPCQVIHIIGTVSRATLGKLLRDRGGAHMGLPERIDTILN